MFCRPLPQVSPGQDILKQPHTHLSVELRDVRPLLREVEELERDKGGVRLRKEVGVCPCLSVARPTASHEFPDSGNCGHSLA